MIVYIYCSGTDENEDRKHLFLTFNSLVQGADKLRQKQSSQKATRISMEERQEEKIKLL